MKDKETPRSDVIGGPDPERPGNHYIELWPTMLTEDMVVIVGGNVLSLDSFIAISMTPDVRQRLEEALRATALKEF